jgi:hypothetical protein
MSAVRERAGLLPHPLWRRTVVVGAVVYAPWLKIDEDLGRSSIARWLSGRIASCTGKRTNSVPLLASLPIIGRAIPPKTMNALWLMILFSRIRDALPKRQLSGRKVRHGHSC